MIRRQIPESALRYLAIAKEQTPLGEVLLERKRGEKRVSS